jgi:hypothetical protein
MPFQIEDVRVAVVGVLSD